MTLTPLHSLAALTEIAQDWPFFTLFVFLMRWQREARLEWDGLTTCWAGIRYSPSICVIFHQLSYRAGVNLFSVTDIFRAQAPPLAELKGTFREILQPSLAWWDHFFKCFFEFRPRFRIYSRLLEMNKLVCDNHCGSLSLWISRPFAQNLYKFNICLDIHALKHMLLFVPRRQSGKQHIYYPPTSATFHFK